MSGGEHDADWRKKQYSANGPNGESVIKTKKWFGFRLYLIADATYELPVAFSVTKASNSEKTETEKLLDKIEKEWEQWLKECKYFLGDKGYDSSKIINRLEENGKKTELVYKGYDKSTDSLRYGFKPQKHDKRIFRIKCEEDRRIFTTVARSSHKWKRLYKKRTGVERINGRIDRDYQFERHTIRGLDKMKMFLTVTFIVYMTMAKAKVMAGQTEHLCKLYA